MGNFPSCNFPSLTFWKFLLGISHIWMLPLQKLSLGKSLLGKYQIKRDKIGSNLVSDLSDPITGNFCQVRIKKCIICYKTSNLFFKKWSSMLCYEKTDKFLMTPEFKINFLFCLRFIQPCPLERQKLNIQKIYQLELFRLFTR